MDAPTGHAQLPIIFSHTGNSRNIGIGGPIDSTYIQYKYCQYQYQYQQIKSTVLQYCANTEKSIGNTANRNIILQY